MPALDVQEERDLKDGTVALGIDDVFKKADVTLSNDMRSVAVTYLRHTVGARNVFELVKYGGKHVDEFMSQLRPNLPAISEERLREALEELYTERLPWYGKMARRAYAAARQFGVVTGLDVKSTIAIARGGTGEE